MQILQGGTLKFSPGKYSAEVEDIAIIKDSYNTVIDNTVKNVSTKEEQVAILDNELGLQLTALEKG